MAPLGVEMAVLNWPTIQKPRPPSRGKQARRAAFYAEQRRARPDRAWQRAWAQASAIAVDTGEGFTITDPRSGCRLMYVPSA